MKWRARRGEKSRLHATGVRGIERPSTACEGRESRIGMLEVKWRARRDSNPRPMASEATTLSG